MKPTQPDKKRKEKKECKEHEPQIVEITEYGFTHHVNGDVCSKCGELL